MTSEERRKCPRVPLNQLAQASEENAETGLHDTLGATRDVSIGGIRFEASSDIDVGKDLLISFAVGENIVRANGQVIHFHTKPDGTVSMGIQFSELTEGDREFLQGHCSEESEDPQD
jgi:PilZ domain